MGHGYTVAAEAVRAEVRERGAELEAAYRSAMAGWDAAIRAAMVAGLPVDSRAYAVAAEVAAGIQTARENDGFPTVVIPVGPVRGLIVAAAAAGLLPESERRPSESRSLVCGTVRLHADGSDVVSRGSADDAHTAAYRAWSARDEWRRSAELAAGL